MIIKTRKYKLNPNTYVGLGLRNVIREQWWVFFIADIIASGTFWIKTMWFLLGTGIALLLYLLFWLVQFYGITYLEQNQVLFEPLRYEVSSEHIVVQVTPKQGIPIAWKQVKRARKGRDHFLLVISKAHIIHLPHKIFNSPHEIKFVETILKRKTLI